MEIRDQEEKDDDDDDDDGSSNDEVEGNTKWKQLLFQSNPDLFARRGKPILDHQCLFVVSRESKSF